MVVAPKWPDEITLTVINPEKNLTPPDKPLKASPPLLRLALLAALVLIGIGVLSFFLLTSR